MLVLFDQGTPRTLARHLIDHHTVTEARARGWEREENGELLTLAEEAGFEVLVTTDQKSELPAEPEEPKNCACRIGEGPVEGLIKPHIPQIVAAVNAATPGSFAEVDIPYPD
jgi:hypothetical protein